MNLEEALKSEPPCHPLACAIQECLSRKSYQQDKCKRYVDDLYDCCNAFYQRNGSGAKTVACPKANLLKLKMKQRIENR